MAKEASKCPLKNDTGLCLSSGRKCADGYGQEICNASRTAYSRGQLDERLKKQIENASPDAIYDVIKKMTGTYSSIVNLIEANQAFVDGYFFYKDLPKSRKRDSASLRLKPGTIPDKNEYMKKILELDITDQSFMHGYLRACVDRFKDDK